MEMLMNDVWEFALRSSGTGRLDPNAILIQSAFCGLPMLAIAFAVAFMH